MIINMIMTKMIRRLHDLVSWFRSKIDLFWSDDFIFNRKESWKRGRIFLFLIEISWLAPVNMLSTGAAWKIFCLGLILISMFKFHDEWDSGLGRHEPR